MGKKSHSYWNEKFATAGFYIKGNKKKELVSGSKYRKMSRKDKKKLFEKLTKKWGSHWPKPPPQPKMPHGPVTTASEKIVKATQPNAAQTYAAGEGVKFGTGHSDGWDWMDVKKKKDAKKVDWAKRYKEAGFYIPGNGRAEAISYRKWKDMDYEDKWKRYGELTGMTRFSDIDKDNWDDINWEAKFKDRPGAWERISQHWPNMDAGDKWEAYSRLKGEVPDDFDDVFGKDRETDLLEDIEDADGTMPVFKAHEYGGIDYKSFTPGADDKEIFDSSGNLKPEYQVKDVKDLDSAIAAATGKSSNTIEKDVLTAQQQTAAAAMDKAGTGNWAAPVVPEGPAGTQPPTLALDSEQWDDTYTNPTDEDYTAKPEFTTKAETSNVGTYTPSKSNQTLLDTAGKAYDDNRGKPAPVDPGDPRGKPAPDDATAWQGAAGKAKREGLEKDYSAYDPGRTATPGQITSAMGSKLARSEASKSGLNTMGTGAFKYRNPLTINNQQPPAEITKTAAQLSRQRISTPKMSARGTIKDPHRRPDLSRPEGFYNPRRDTKYAKPATKPAWAK